MGRPTSTGPGTRVPASARYRAGPAAPTVTAGRSTATGRLRMAVGPVPDQPLGLGLFGGKDETRIGPDGGVLGSGTGLSGQAPYTVALDRWTRRAPGAGRWRRGPAAARPDWPSRRGHAGRSPRLVTAWDQARWITLSAPSQGGAEPVRLGRRITGQIDDEVLHRRVH